MKDLDDAEVLRLALIACKMEIVEIEHQRKRTYEDFTKELEYVSKFVDEEYNIWEWYTGEKTPEENYQAYLENCKVWKETGVKPRRNPPSFPVKEG